MGMFFIALAYIPRIFLMLIRAIIITFYPIFLGLGLYLLYKIIRSAYEKRQYYDYCKRHKISPADDYRNFIEFEKGDIKDNRRIL